MSVFIFTKSRFYATSSVLISWKRPSIQIIQREEERDRRIYDGRLQAHVILNDIRKGDRLQYAYSNRGKENPVFGDKMALRLFTAWGVPVTLMHYRIICPESRPLTIRTHGKDVDTTITHVGDETHYSWKIASTATVEDEGDLPVDFLLHPFLEASQFATWEEIADSCNHALPRKGKSPPSICRMRCLNGNYCRNALMQPGKPSVLFRMRSAILD